MVGTSPDLTTNTMSACAFCLAASGKATLETDLQPMFSKLLWPWRLRGSSLPHRNSERIPEQFNRSQLDSVLCNSAESFQVVRGPLEATSVLDVLDNLADLLLLAFVQPLPQGQTTWHDERRTSLLKNGTMQTAHKRATVSVVCHA